MRGRKWFEFIPIRFHFRRFSSFDPPPVPPLRRVVVTGMVTPLGCGVETTWKRLIEGECGVRAICPDDLKMNGFEPEVKMYTLDQLTSKVAAIVPYGSSSGEFDEQLWLNSKDMFQIHLFRTANKKVVFCWSIFSSEDKHIKQN